MADLPGETVRPAQQLAVQDERAADPNLPGQIEEAAHVVQPAEPQLGQRREIGLVLRGDRQRRVAGAQGGQRVGEQLLRRDLVPAEVGGLPHRAAGDEARQRQRRAHRAQLLFVRRLQGPRGDPGRPRQGLPGGGAPVVEVFGLPDPAGARQVHHAHRHVIDVDLHAEPGRTGAGHLERGAGAARVPAERLARLGEEPAVHQLLDERGHRGPGQPDPGGHPGTGRLAALALVPHGAQYQAQIVPSHGVLVGLGPQRSEDALHIVAEPM
ncbi:hypothetical protein EES46_16955 [Streptomyces sp. ADI98-10]|nr:hypothetical protein EES46_16955 [Streptomyces sp. ADI98-10]